MKTGLIRLLLLAALWVSSPVRADHFSGVNMGYQCMGSGFWMIYLELYLDCAGVPLQSQTIKISNACGTPEYSLTLTAASSITQEVSPLCQSSLNSSTCNPGGTLPGFRRHRWERNLFFAPCSEWKVSWYACCRNVLVNVVNEPGTYVETRFNNVVASCDNSPVFPETGIPYICVNRPVSYNPGVTDADGNLLIFSLIPARFASPTPFPVTYEAGHSATTPIPGLSFDPLSGQLSGTPTTVGNYAVVFKVDSYDAFGNLVGTVMRDVMFVVLICDDEPPISPGMTNISPGVLFGPNSLGVCNGTSFCVDVAFSDSEPGAVLIIQSNAATALPGSTFTVNGTNPAIATICWNTNEAQLPANLFIQAFDGACPIENVASRSILVASCVFLPIELISFTAEPISDLVHLEWVTATERNNKLFTIERSRDGTHFETIGSLYGAGDSQAAIRYSFDDISPMAGLSYYRLRQTDTDGSSTLSKVVPVNLRSEKDIYAVFDGTGSWMLGGLPAEGEWLVMDMLGRIIARAQLQGAEFQHMTHFLETNAMHLLIVRYEGRQQLLRLPAFAGPGTQVTATSL